MLDAAKDGRDTKGAMQKWSQKKKRSRRAVDGIRALLAGVMGVLLTKVKRKGEY